MTGEQIIEKLADMKRGERTQIQLPDRVVIVEVINFIMMKKDSKDPQ